MPAPTLAAATPAPTAAAGQVAPASYNSVVRPRLHREARLRDLPAPGSLHHGPDRRRFPPRGRNVLVAALKGLGYNASARSEPTDKLFHVQVGPFATRDQAMAMRAKLINDGYNAILK